MFSVFKVQQIIIFKIILAEEIHMLKKCTKFCKHQWSAVTSKVTIREYLYCNLNEEVFFTDYT